MNDKEQYNNTIKTGLFIALNLSGCGKFIVMILSALVAIIAINLTK